MKRSKLHVYLAFAASNFISIMLTSQTPIPMVPQNWEPYQNAKTNFETFEGISIVKLEGKMFVKDVNLTHGTIEVDVYAHSKRSFAGIIFRKKDHNMEDFYIRTHKSGQVDAVQYTPVYNGESNWQLYNEYQAQLVLKQSSWNKLKVIFKDKIADIYVNDVKVLTVDELKSENTSGSIGLFSLFENRFTNFRYSNDSKDMTTANIKDISSLSKGLIKEWQITEAIDPKNEPIDFKNFGKLSYKKVVTEASGLLPISKFITKPNFGNFEDNIEAYTIAKHEWSENAKTFKTFSFDYSDKILVYLNGVLIFKGNNAFRSKGAQFMGHLDIGSNKLILPLKKGKNVLHCVVIEQANGWGLIGKFE
jgi:hypothetical protein